MEASKRGKTMVSKMGSVQHLSTMNLGGIPAYCLRGTRRIVGASLIRPLVWNMGTLHRMVRENPISEGP